LKMTGLPTQLKDGLLLPLFTSSLVGETSQ
jgi:hypothetical protein